MQLPHLRAFLLVIEAGSLTRAAAQLHIGQPALTRQIAALEQEIGARLFDRTGRGVMPTAAGQALAAKLAKPLQEIETALWDARRFAHGERSTLRIGYLQSLARTYLNPALAAVRVKFPQLRVELTDLCAGGQIRGLQAGTIDVALMGPDARALRHDYYVRHVQQLGVAVAMPADHALAQQPVVRMADLRLARFVGKDEEAADYNGWVEQLCRRAGFRPRFVQRANSISQVLLMTVSEGAVALIPEIAADADAPLVVTRQIVDPWAKWDFFAVWQRGRIAAAVKVLLEALPTRAAPPPADLGSRMSEFRRPPAVLQEV